MQMLGAPDHVAKWLNKCLPDGSVHSCSAENLKNGTEREVWDCTFMLGGTESRAILAIFKPGSLSSVNTSLPPDQATRKCVLAMSELPAHGISNLYGAWPGSQTPGNIE